MKKIILLIFIFIAGHYNSQISKCDTVSKKNIYYVSFEIKSKKNYPIKMFGIFKNYKIKKFDKRNIEFFIKSFYNKGKYTPYLTKGYNKMLYECVTDSLRSNSFLDKNKIIVSNILQKIENDSHTDIISLDTGEQVLLKVLNIDAVFFKTSKNNKGIFNTSMEWDINDIKEINEIYVPFDNLKINSCQKK